MTLQAAIDNDVIIKMACYDLLDLAMNAVGKDSKFSTLGAAKFVAISRISKSAKIRDRERARNALDRFLQVADELEPTADEIFLATEIEELAIAEGAELDVGESQLCAIVATRSFALLITGDKRAIKGAGRLLSRSPLIAALAGKILCLEQLILQIISSSRADHVRSRICSEPAVDKSLSICFSCSRPDRDVTELTEGLYSYIRSVRDTAPSLLFVNEFGSDD